MAVLPAVHPAPSVREAPARETSSHRVSACWIPSTPSPGPRKPAVPARLRRRQTDRLEPRERAAVLSQQLRGEPIALGVQSLESGAIGLKALRLAIGREAPDQREIAPLDLVVAGVLVDAEDEKGVGRHGLSAGRRSERGMRVAEGRGDHGLGHHFEDLARHGAAERRLAEPVGETRDGGLPSARPREPRDFVPRNGVQESPDYILKHIEALGLLLRLAPPRPPLRAGVVARAVEIAVDAAAAEPILRDRARPADL